MSRKYRQRGYMDDGSEERRRKPGGPKPQRREGPRGRGLGAPTESRFKCARCGAEARFEPEVTVGAACAKCGSALHTCTNCRHFDTSARFECRVEIPQRIAAKSRGNECGLFEPKLVQVFASDTGKPADPKSAFDSLFDF